MPIFLYKCLDCEYEFEKIVIDSQAGFSEPDQCPECRSNIIEKMVTAPAQIRMDGKAGLRSVPDPKPPLQELRGKNKSGCEGGYADLPEFKPTERKKTKGGNWEWSEKKKQYIDMKRGGKK
jgi:putative FmdB family regulatory protein